MGEVGACFGQAGDAILARGRTAAQFGELREHEPDPVGALAASAQLGQHSLVHPILGIDKALEIEDIRHVLTVAHRPL